MEKAMVDFLQVPRVSGGLQSVKTYGLDGRNWINVGDIGHAINYPGNLAKKARIYVHSDHKRVIRIGSKKIVTVDREGLALLGNYCNAVALNRLNIIIPEVDNAMADRARIIADEKSEVYFTDLNGHKVRKTGNQRFLIWDVLKAYGVKYSSPLYTVYLDGIEVKQEPIRIKCGVHYSQDSKVCASTISEADTEILKQRLEIKSGIWEKPEVGQEALDKVAEEMFDAMKQELRSYMGEPNYPGDVAEATEVEHEVLEGELVEAENVEPEVSESKHLTPFVFENNPIRIEIGEGGEPWFIAKDVCDVLGIVNVSQAVSRLDDDQKASICITDTSSSSRQTAKVLAVNESGLYDVTLDSRKPEARRIRKWVVSDVMPTLRKTGRYQIGPPEAQVPATIDNRQLALLIESMAKRDDQFERLLVANTNLCVQTTAALQVISVDIVNRLDSLAQKVDSMAMSSVTTHSVATVTETTHVAKTKGSKAPKTTRVPKSSKRTRVCSGRRDLEDLVRKVAPRMFTTPPEVRNQLYDHLSKETGRMITNEAKSIGVSVPKYLEDTGLLDVAYKVAMHHFGHFLAA